MLISVVVIASALPACQSSGRTQPGHDGDRDSNPGMPDAAARNAEVSDVQVGDVQVGEVQDGTAAAEACEPVDCPPDAGIDRLDAGDAAVGEVAPSPTTPSIEDDAGSGPVTCGFVVCEPPSDPVLIGLPPVPSCCADTQLGICGFRDETGDCVVLPEDHPECPSIEPILDIEVRSCCLTETNRCGVLYGPPVGDGVECTALEDLEPNDLVAIPHPVACDTDVQSE
jgi:hypothetical protein